MQEFIVSNAESYQILCNEAYNKKVVIEPKITQLDLSKIEEKNGFRLFCEGLSHCTTLLTLDVSHMNMQLEQCVYLLDALKLNKSVTKLNLHGNFLGTVSIRYFQELFQNNSTLKYLNLQTNNLGDGGCELICQMLENNRSLTSLSLANNSLTSKSLIYIEMMLQSNKTLTHLDVSRNKLTDPSGFERSFNKALQLTETLRRLDLYATRITLKDLKDGLIANQSLEHLNISGNYVKDTDLDEIDEILSKNTTLKSLNLRNIVISPKGFENLADGLRSNQTLTSIAAEVHHCYDRCIEPIIDALETNYSLADVDIVQKAVGMPDVPSVEIQEILKEMRKKRIEDVRIVMVNLIRTEALQRLPVEMWHMIFSFVNYPGINIDFGEEFKRMMHNMKIRKFIKEGMKITTQALIENLFDALTAQ